MRSHVGGPRPLCTPMSPRRPKEPEARAHCMGDCAGEFRVVAAKRLITSGWVTIVVAAPRVRAACDSASRAVVARLLGATSVQRTGLLCSVPDAVCSL